ncbi:MAG: DUF4407 domain-containing protein [Cyclobacteriaceae bacterium]
MSRLTDQSSAIWAAHIFILLLFLIMESTPILVKLFSKKGPYDSLIHIQEHNYRCKEIEAVAIVSSETRKNSSVLENTEQGYVTRKLDTELI